MSFEPDAILAVLARHRVRFIVIGGVAATLHGSPFVTTDVDITPSSDAGNLRRLSDALRELTARVRAADAPEGLPFDHDGRSLADAAIWNLTTRHGELDICFAPSGTRGYVDLARDAVTIRIRGTDLMVASLADVIRSKEAAGREKDRVVLPVLRRLLEALDGRG